jgi:hypothetical protein
MSNSILQFGESRPEYQVPVLNERAVRAAAGILFLFAIVSFMNAWLTGNFQPTRVFVVTFLVDFTIRIFINPRFAPSLIVGQWMVARQQPEWVGAPQKRFAWAIGFVLALTMLYLVVIKNVIGPINVIVCSLCLTLLFFEAAFGICIGCAVYNLFNKEHAQLCPGGACDPALRVKSGPILPRLAMVALFAVVVVGVTQWVYRTGASGTFAAQNLSATPPSGIVDAAEAERCKVPDFAKAIGHEAQWKLHNNCR